MGTLDQTVQVLDLSPKVTLTELNTFFSYCGTIDKVHLVRNEDQSQLAYVTFRQPYALRTALLLNGAIVVDRPIRVFRLQSLVDIPIIEKMTDGSQNNNHRQGLIPSAEPGLQGVALEGYEAFLRLIKERGDEDARLFDEKFEKEWVESEQKRRAMISAVEQTAERMRCAIMSNDHFSAGALWLSGVLDKAAKYTADLGNTSKSKRSNPNSRKQK